MAFLRGVAPWGQTARDARREGELEIGCVAIVCQHDAVCD
jgi:hypothetical protein